MQVESLLAQTGIDLEIVAVDDRSTDSSLELLRAYARRDPRIRVHSNRTNLGHLRSFEKCMGLCTAPLIAPCDQDDIWHPRKLITLVHAIGNADMAYCNSAYIDHEGRPLGRNISDDLRTMHSGRDPMKYVFQNTVSGHALLVRRDVFDTALPFPPALYHDWWLAMRAAAGNGVVYVDEPLVQFRRHLTAYSPLGKKRTLTRREIKQARRQRKQARAAGLTDHADRLFDDAPDRKWLQERLYLMHALGVRDWRGSAQARKLETALHDASEGDDRGLFREIWRNRASLPPFKGVAWFNALQFFKRSRRKLGRARTQGPVPGPLFRA